MVTTTEFLYDVFVSNSAADREWVEEKLLPRLRDAKLIIATSDQVDVGANTLDEIERLVRVSRRVIVVLSPNWAESEFKDFDISLTRNLDPLAYKRKLLPLKIAPCEIPKSISSLRLSIADVSDAKHTERELRRMTRSVRDAVPRPPPWTKKEGIVSPQEWWQWLEHYRRKVAFAAVIACVCILVVLMLAQVVPFEPRLGWQAVGSIPVSGSHLLTRAHDVLLIATLTDFDSCQPKDTGLWRSTDDGKTWGSITIVKTEVKSPKKRGIKSPLFAARKVRLLAATLFESLRAEIKGDAQPWQ